jgi:hypothetical protein
VVVQRYAAFVDKLQDRGRRERHGDARYADVILDTRRPARLAVSDTERAHPAAASRTPHADADARQPVVGHVVSHRERERSSQLQAEAPLGAAAIAHEATISAAHKIIDIRRPDVAILSRRLVR